MQTRLKLTAIALGLGLSLFACDRESGRCDVEIMNGCAAQCKRKEGNKVCSSAIMLSREASNAILQQQSTNVVVEDLPEETCFTVNEDNTFADSAARDGFVKACEAAFKKADRPAEPPPK